MATGFASVYNRFLGKITDDMYVELTPEDTIRDLRTLLIEALPGFEFPRIDLFAYELNEIEKTQEELNDGDFVIGTVWAEFDDKLSDALPSNVLVEDSYFEAELTSEEINILAILMMINWVQRQVTSIENTRMKYSGTDFKMTSQANHLAKLINLLSECQRQSHHMQRLYKRRRFRKNNVYRSNWDMFGYGVYNFDPILHRAMRPPKPEDNPDKKPSDSKTIEECEAYWSDMDEEQV